MGLRRRDRDTSVERQPPSLLGTVSGFRARASVSDAQRPGHDPVTVGSYAPNSRGFCEGPTCAAWTVGMRCRTVESRDRTEIRERTPTYVCTSYEYVQWSSVRYEASVGISRPDTDAATSPCPGRRVSSIRAVKALLGQAVDMRLRDVLHAYRMYVRTTSSSSPSIRTYSRQ